jgi:hypothetical protein
LYILSLGDKTTEEVSLVVKATNQTSFHCAFSPIGRPFVREVFWFNNAYPELTKLYPEIASISPGKTVLLYTFINLIWMTHKFNGFKRLD